jgi:hypothetical protein
MQCSIQKVLLDIEVVEMTPRVLTMLDSCVAL